MKRIFTISLGFGLAASVLSISLLARGKVIDRAQEKKDFPDLQANEDIQDKNIANAYARLTTFGPLVPLAQEDRMAFFKERQDPNDFRNALRNIVYTPRNTYVRYVKDNADLLLVGFGTPAETEAKIKEKVQEAVSAGVQVTAPTFQGREGIELTQFEFIFQENEPGREATGSKRKTLSLFYKRAGQGGVDTEKDFVLDFVVARIVEDDLRKGIRDVELVIDPTPGTENMDDVIILHRHNEMPSQAMVLGAMANTPNFPLRNQFKQKFYGHLMDQYNILYRLVDGYARRDSNSYQESVLERLRKSTEY